MPHPADPRRPGTRRTAAVGGVLVGVLGVTLALVGCAVGDPLPDGARGPGADPPVSAPAATAPERADRSAAGRARPEGSDPAPSTQSRASGTGATAASTLPAVPVRSAALGDVDAATAVPPVRLDIPALGIAVPIDPVGVQPDGQMEIPPLVERAGWYRFGPAPGEPAGTAVVAAHVDSVASAGLGPFARLRDAAVGDVVDVTLADGSVRTFTVSSVERRAKPEIVWSEVFVRDGAPRLVLVTCGGTFRRDVGHYSDNVVVTAEPVRP